jgi:flavin reductase (DIM6/NTAB) family NADH-FMN oxidoreductase RutF
MIIDPGQIATKDLHQYLLGSVAPRPIAFVSSVDKNGVTNLAPYSFFNAFSSNPPVVVFSSNRRVSDNTTKDTLSNIEQTRECVINVVSHRIVRQMALTSIDYPADVSEFDKAGFTSIPSDLIKPPRVAESPVNMECKVRDIIALGTHGGAGHLIICDVVRMHISEEVLDEEGRIDPDKIDLMGRLGRAFYTRASGKAIYKIYQPYNVIGMGFDQMPERIKRSAILTGNQIAEIAALTAWPPVSEVVKQAASLLKMEEIHRMAADLIDKGNISEAAEWLQCEG